MVNTKIQTWITRDLDNVIVDFHKDLNKAITYRTVSKIEASQYLADLVKRSKIVFIKKGKNKLIVNFENALW